MSKAHAVLKFLRKIHLYLGIFTTPALLFFASTGAMQTFNLHESAQGSSYKPPSWVASMAQLHKKQDTTVPVRKARPMGTEQGAKSGSREQQPEAKSPVAAPTPTEVRKSHTPMKIFFLLVAVSLAISTLTGLYMSYKYQRSKWQITALVLAGLIVPLVLLPF